MKPRYILIACIFLTHNYCHTKEEYIGLFKDKNICITGGTGFIGNALIDGILKYSPKKITVFSRDEVKHYRLLNKYKYDPIKSIIGDVRDYDSIFQATKDADLVIHAAALKRIDLMEYHIKESVYTNLLGSMNVARACLENNVKQALLVSTDKACSPVNVYGACKFLSEKVFTNFAGESDNTQLVVVRYGNVLESTGSVIPFFCNKLKHGEVIPLTDEKMTRFFIAKEQAVELIFNALKYGQGGEVFVPHIPSFKITDLIEVLQEKLNVFTPIETVGIRPGEKIHEIMINNTEIDRTYQYKNFFVITPTVHVSHKNEPVYKKFGRRLKADIFFEYSSGTSILSQKELLKLLKEFNISLEYDQVKKTMTL